MCLGGGEIEAWRRPCSPTTRTDSLPAAHKRTCSPPTIAPTKLGRCMCMYMVLSAATTAPAAAHEIITRSHAISRLSSERVAWSSRKEEAEGGGGEGEVVSEREKEEEEESEAMSKAWWSRLLSSSAACTRVMSSSCCT